jgi:hypothetical protein
MNLELTMDTPEVQALFAAGLSVVGDLLPEDNIHVIEDVPEMTELAAIIREAVRHSKTAVTPMSTRNWAARKSFTERKKPRTSFVGAAITENAPIQLPELTESVELLEDTHMLLSVNVLFPDAIEFICPQQPSVTLSSHGVPASCHLCGQNDPIRLGTEEGEETF